MVSILYGTHIKIRPQWRYADLIHIFKAFWGHADPIFLFAGWWIQVQIAAITESISEVWNF